LIKGCNTIQYNNILIPNDKCNRPALLAHWAFPLATVCIGQVGVGPQRSGFISRALRLVDTCGLISSYSEIIISQAGTYPLKSVTGN